MFFFLVYVAARRLARLLVGRSSVAALEVENAVLRHQLAVLRRTVKRLRLRRRDRVLLAVAASLLPRERWPVFRCRRRRSCAGSGSWCGEGGRSGAEGLAGRR